MFLIMCSSWTSSSISRMSSPTSPKKPASPSSRHSPSDSYEDSQVGLSVSTSFVL